MTGMLKAISAGAIAFGGALLTASQSGDVTGNEWWFIAGTTIVALGGVWAIPNSGAKPVE